MKKFIFIFVLVVVSIMLTTTFCFADNETDFIDIPIQSVYFVCNSTFNQAQLQTSGGYLVSTQNCTFFKVIILFDTLDVTYFNSLDLLFNYAEIPIGSVWENNNVCNECYFKVINNFVSLTDYSTYLETYDISYTGNYSFINGSRHMVGYQCKCLENETFNLPLGIELNFIGTPNGELLHNDTCYFEFTLRYTYNPNTIFNIGEIASINGWTSLTNNLSLSSFVNCQTLFNSIFTRLQTIPFITKVVSWAVFVGIFGTIVGTIGAIFRKA